MKVFFTSEQAPRLDKERNSEVKEGPEGRISKDRQWVLLWFDYDNRFRSVHPRQDKFTSGGLDRAITVTRTEIVVNLL